MPEEAVIVEAPFSRAVSRPAVLIVATVGLSLAQVIVPAKVWPFWSTTLALSVAVSPTNDSVTEVCEILTEVARGGSEGVVPPSEPPQLNIPNRSKDVRKAPILECFTDTTP